jgi:hypothetical protein
MILETERESTRLHNVENSLWKGQINFNLPTSFILSLIDHISVLICRFLHIYIQGGANMTGTDLCVNKPHKSRSYLNHLVYIYIYIYIYIQRPTTTRSCLHFKCQYLFIYSAGCTVFPHLPAPIKQFDHYTIFFLQLFLSFQSSSMNPLSPISPLIPSAQVSV